MTWYMTISRVATFVVSLLMTLGLYHQAWKIRQTKSAKDLAWTAVLAIVLNEVAWFNYGLALHEWPIIAIGILNCPAALWTGIGFIRYRKGYQRRREPLWDLYAKCYDAITILRPYQDLLGDLVKALQPKSGMKILDVGCGTGNLSATLQRTGASIYGLDFSEGMLVRANRKTKGVLLVRADLNENLPFADDTFDAVAANNVFYTLPKSRKVVSELRRITKPGGTIVISDPKPGSSFMQIFWEHLRVKPLRSFLPRLLGVMYRFPQFVVVAITNIVIDRAVGKQYIFRSREDWEFVAGEPNTISETYAQQNWIITTRS